MTYIHDFSGRTISRDAYLALPSYEQRQYHPIQSRTSRHTDDGIDLVDVGIGMAIGYLLGNNDDSGSNSSPDSGNSSSSSFDEGFGGGGYSGGGVGSDY